MLIKSEGVWSSDDLNHILRTYGAFIVERQGTDIDDALSTLKDYENNIFLIKSIILNDVSSTKIRLFLRKDLSHAVSSAQI